MYSLQKNLIDNLIIGVSCIPMSTRPLTAHPLNQVRSALGWTQQKLAEKCGCAVVTIKKIEAGRLTPGRDLLGRLMWTTGVDPGSLSGKAPTFQGRPYTSESGNAYLASIKTTDKFGDVSIDGWTEVFIEQQVDILREVMAHALKKSAFKVARWSFLEWTASTVFEFGMEKDFIATMKKPDANHTQGTLLRGLMWRKKLRRLKAKG